MEPNPELDSGQPDQTVENTTGIRRVNRMILPALRLMTDANRLSIMETLAASGNRLSVHEIRGATDIPNSSFFKFIADFEAVGLVQNFGNRSGVYQITEQGLTLLDSLIDTGQRLSSNFLNKMIDDLRKNGVGETEIKQIKDILSRKSQGDSPNLPA